MCIYIIFAKVQKIFAIKRNISSIETSRSDEFLFNLLVHTFSTRCNEFPITGEIHIEDRARVPFQRANHPGMRELLLRFASLLVFSTFVATTARPNRPARRISWFFELYFIRFSDIWKDKYIIWHCTPCFERTWELRTKCLRTYHRPNNRKIMENERKILWNRISSRYFDKGYDVIVDFVQV